MANQSLFQIYSNYDKRIVLLSIKTMTPEDKILLKKGYGEDYSGKRYLYASEEFPFDMADRKLGRRIKEIDELIKQGKTEDEIVEIYAKQRVQGSFTSYSSTNSSSTKNKPRALVKASLSTNENLPKPSSSIRRINKPLEEYFPESVRQAAMEYINIDTTEEEKELLNYFYADSKYEICRRYADDYEKIIEFDKFINRINDEVISMKSSKHKNEKNYKQSLTENKVKRQIEDVNYSRGGKRARGLLADIPSDKIQTSIKIIEKFEHEYPNYYAVIKKRYSGEHFEIINDVKLSHNEQTALSNARGKIKELLEEGAKEFIEKSYIFNGYLKSFPEEDYEMVLKIVKEVFPKSNPNYYRVINKKYSGEFLEIVNDVELDDLEKYSLKESRKRVKKLLNNPINEGYLASFTEHFEYALQITKNFQDTNPNYYAAITKRYSGEHFEIVNDVELTDKEKYYIADSRTKIRKLIEKLNEKPEVLCDISSIDDILRFMPINKKLSTDSMTIEQIIDCYIDNLDSFSSSDIPFIIKIIATYEPNKISKLINCSYMKNRVKNLTIKEQVYIYLTLLSYNKSWLTEEKIKEIIEEDKQYLQEWETIINQGEIDINKINMLFKKNTII